MTDQQNLFDIAEQMGDITVSRLSPEVLEEARQQRFRDAAQRAANPPRLPESGYTLWAELVSATIMGDHIEVAIRMHGQVQRPEALATAEDVVLTLKVPAKVERRAA